MEIPLESYDCQQNKSYDVNNAILISSQVKEYDAHQDENERNCFEAFEGEVERHSGEFGARGIFSSDVTKDLGVSLEDKNNQDKDDLEDGEIETDGEDGQINAEKPASLKNELNDKCASSPSILNHKPLNFSSPKGENEDCNPDNILPVPKKGRFRRSEYMDDDWAGNIENAIAAALKIDGKEPTLPKLGKRTAAIIDSFDNLDDIRRNRKRKKRGDKEKGKVKRIKQHENEHRGSNQADDIDEDEMVCVRGGSPVLPSSIHLRCSPSPFSAHYDSEDGYQSSYSSYDSAENRKMSFEERRQARRAKDRRNRSNNSQSASANARGAPAISKRRNRHDSDGVCIMNMRGRCNYGDDCHRSHDARTPRKLELCKFYLMDCCAKKDKCSYMHADFPCKYYYLGMECVYKSDCKFSHGDPLSEQLRNILLKHIETAPKEILGNFRRISRENALNLLVSTHARLCAEKGMVNKLDTPSVPASQSFIRNSRSPVDNRGLNTTSQSSRMQSRSPSEGICNNFASSESGLITMNSNEEENWDADDYSNHLPTNNVSSTTCSNNQSVTKAGEKQRKSRWRESQTAPLSNSGLSIHPGVASDILSLKNLKGVITPEQIDRLEAIGIANLEQISQLTVAQLNNVGLTISQINEIQLNAMNIEKLGLISKSTKTEPSQYLASSDITSLVHTSSSCNDDSQSIQDIDMRCLVGAVQTTGTGQQILPVKQLAVPLPASVSACHLQDSEENFTESVQILTQNETVSSASVDFTKYLRDSNVKTVGRTNFNEILKDDKEDDDEILNEDEPGLLIDESRCAPSEEEFDVQNRDEKTENVFSTKGEDDDNWDDDDADNTVAGVNVNLSCLKADEYNAKGEDMNAIWNPDTNRLDNRQKFRCQENVLSSQCSNRWNQRVKYDSWEEKNKNQVCQNKTRVGSWQDDSKSVRFDKSKNDKRQREQNPNRCAESDDETWRIEEVSSNLRRVHNFSSDFSNSKESPIPPADYELALGGKQDSFLNRRNKICEKAPLGRFPDPRLQNVSLAEPNQKNDDACLDNKPSVDNYSGDWDSDDNAESKEIGMYSKSVPCEILDAQLDVIPSVIREPSPPQKYQRRSIYDGNSFDDSEEDKHSQFPADDDGCGFSADRDMRISPYLESGDIDLRLPFKPVMTNYTPATEIDGSIASHAPILYKVYEILIPKPDYTEIRRSMTVTEKTLDPRLRRIFCLKESTNAASENEILKSSSQLAKSNPHAVVSNPDINEKCGVSTPLCGPRLDPRRRKENSDVNSSNSLLTKSTGLGSTGAFGLGQNVDIRLLLQKSLWYKNLNSKFKIMVNQQLALVSTELKKFHQDPKPDKVFDMKFLVTNQYLQQVLTNLGIFIDGNGQIRQLDSECDDAIMGGQNGGQGMMLPSAGMMMESVSSLGMSMNLCPPQSSNIGTVNSRFMGPSMINSFGPRIPADICSNILRASPPIKPFNQFEVSGNPFSTGNFCGPSGSDEYMKEQQYPSNNQFENADGANYYGGLDRSSGGCNRNRIFRQNSLRNNTKDRWSAAINSNTLPGRNSAVRNRSFENRFGNSDREPGNPTRRVEKLSNQLQEQSATQEEESWD